MTPAPNTADAQLERILYILPMAARAGSAKIGDIARALGVDESTVLRDLEHATARSFFHPAGTVESFSITTDGINVQVHAPVEFRRPVRLNQREALALGLGLRTLAADAAPDRRAEILALATRLEADLAAPDVLGSAMVSEASMRPVYQDLPMVAETSDEDGGYDVAHDRDVDYDVEYDYDELAIAFGDDGFRGVVADAIELGRCCTIMYLKPGDDAPVHRRIAPYRLVYASGRWYVASHDLERDGLRFFRMDRVLNATLSEDAAPPPTATLDEMLARGVPYYATDEVEVSVRYSPRVARWITEYTGAPLEDDGSVLLRHSVADPRWIVRHVLQYGGDAVIEEPRPARRWVAAAAARAGV